MPNLNISKALVILSAVVFPFAGTAHAQVSKSGNMFCWKTKAGKTECGDKVPYEY